MTLKESLLTLAWLAVSVVIALLLTKMGALWYFTAVSILWLLILISRHLARIADALERDDR